MADAKHTLVALVTLELRALILLHVREEARLLGEADALGACDGHNLYTEASEHRKRAEEFRSAIAKATGSAA